MGDFVNKVRRLFGRPINVGQRMIVLGMDGLDPEMIRRGIEDGNLPNFKQLANSGHFSPLGTTWMPLSPVAWASFISGSNPGVHGIFDFLHRDPENYQPHLSIAHQHPPPRTVELGDYELPLSSGQTEAGRKGPAYWTESSRNGIRTDVIRCPVSFPPEPVRGKMLSGLGVPDLNGTQGSFHFFTSHPEADTEGQGGWVFQVEHPKKGPRTIDIKGPPNPFLCEETQSTAELLLEIENGVLNVDFPGGDIQLKEGEWSNWITLSFDFLGPVNAEGRVRLFLKSIEPHFELYVSPVNISPDNPAFPISYPESYSSKLEDDVGPYHTLGLTADTGILKERRVRDEVFLEQAYTVLDEREKMLKHELTSFEDGLFTCVFDIPDRIQHMFWRYQDSSHPLFPGDSDHDMTQVIPQLYQRMDRVLGWVMDEMASEDDLLICSDHGFNSFRRQFDVNRWLVENDYMVLQDGTSPGEAGQMFQAVDWSKTKAYCIGLAGIYLNIRGREKHGCVDVHEAQELKETLANDLKDYKDPQDGTPVVGDIKFSEQVYRGDQLDQSPDLLVGYNEGYRVSWESVLGGVMEDPVSDNMNPWSGDHALEPSNIPGTLMTTMSTNGSGDISISDLMPEVLKSLGIGYDQFTKPSTSWLE
ncbi:MAG: alkaline phosphatase family protein [bacterium]